MPIYEYQCGACGHRLEALQKFSDEPLKECPTCHQPSLDKLISATSFQLKGTGWYATDIRDKGKPKPDQSSAPKTETTEIKTTEAKTKDTDSSGSNSTDSKTG